MKRTKLILAAAIAAIVSVAAGFYSYQATQGNLLAQVELAALEANIEALTTPEGGKKVNGWRGCYTCVVFPKPADDEYKLRNASSCLFNGDSCGELGLSNGSYIGQCYY